MTKPRHDARQRWRVLFAMAITTALLGLAGSASAVQAAPDAPAQGAPLYCQWLPPEWLPFFPECQGGGGGGEPGAPVEEEYSAAGPWETTSTTDSAPGTPGVRITYPVDLGADGYEHPILVFGNGTGATCDQTTPAQEPLAAWGYVVVCPQSGQVGSGDEMLAAVQWMVAQDGNPSSIFAGKLGTDNVGAYGGSQGAGGAVLATQNSNGLITSTVPVVAPDLIWWTHPQPNLSELEDPVFYIWGANDFLSFNRVNNFYNPTAPPKAMVDMVGVGHDVPLDRVPYMIAWFKYTLEGDQFARSAFVETDGNAPEISTNSAWTNFQSQGLP